MKKIIVTEKYNNKKLNNFLLDSFPDMNKSTLYKALRKKDIRINDVKISEDTLLHSGDEITLYILDQNLFKTAKASNLKIIYEDDNILVVNKPNGIEVINFNLSDQKNTISLTDIVKEKYGNEIEPCHRIDRNTKGLVLFAKNKKSLEILLQKFKNKEIEKHYLAKVYGIPKKQHDILSDYLFKDSKKSQVYISKNKTKESQNIITEYSVISSNKSNNTSILDINLHTGRTHQIRAHLAYIGFPILGDGKYGKNEINKKFKLKSQELYSYMLKFNFKSDNGILNYLNNKIIKIDIKMDT